MEIYLKIEDIKGGVESLGFVGAIKIESLDFSADGAVEMHDGISSTPVTLSGITLTKKVDSSSTSLLRQLCYSGLLSPSKVIVSFVQQGPKDKGEEFVQYILEDAKLDRYAISANSEFPLETIRLLYRRITFKYIAFDKEGNKSGQMHTGYDIDKRQVL
jgi:type VI protein secretion system component Hcp